MSQASFVIQAVGALLCMVSLFAPWLTLTPQSHLDPALRSVVETLVGLLQRFGPPAVRELLDSLGGFTQIRGWTLAFGLPFVNKPLLAALIISPAVLGMLSLTWNLLAQWQGWNRVARVGAALQIVVAVVLTTILVVNIPTIERLGLDGGLLVDLALALFNVQIGLGVWGTLLGLALLASSASLRFAIGESASQPAYRPATWYR
jgi:hypothetical protein